MDGLFLKKPAGCLPFSDFGLSRYWHASPGQECLDLNQTRRDIRRQIRDRCPDAPGVYGMVDRHRQLIYVGMSQRLRQRLQTYFVKSSLHGKESRVSGYARSLVWQPAGHGLTALLRELELIRRFRPKFNVRGKSRGARRGYLFLTAGEGPKFRLDRSPPRGSRHVWGPLPAGRAMREAVERLNHHFQLRDCPRHVPMHFSDQLQFFTDPLRPQCLRAEMQTCLGPCAGMCSRRDYAAQVERARQFLEGRCTAEVLGGLEADMLEAATGQRFERAAALRDAWETLSLLAQQLDLVREVHERYWFVYPVPCPAAGDPVWQLVANGRVVASVAAPQCTVSAASAADALKQAFPPGPRLAQDDLRHFDEVRAVASWFRQQPEELQKTLTPEDAHQMCRGVANG